MFEYTLKNKWNRRIVKKMQYYENVATKRLKLRKLIDVIVLMVPLNGLNYNLIILVRNSASIA